MVSFPLLLIPLAIYNIIVFLMPGVSLAEPVVKLTLMSGAEWPVNLSDILLALGILLLLLEVIKGARPGSKYFFDHLLSFIVFGAAAAEFVLWPRFGTSTFLLLTMLALVDFLSGIALRVRRGMRVAPGAAFDGRGVEKADTVAPEPRIEPVPVPVPASPKEPPVPAAASVAESVLLDHSEPKIVHSSVTPAPSREVQSPELQPGGTSSAPSPEVPPR